MRKYQSYNYDVRPIEVEIATGGHEEHPDIKIGYEYFIHDVYCSGDGHESSEWYETEGEAVIAAEEQIEYFMDGQDPDYDVQEYGQIDWDERRRMGE